MGDEWQMGGRRVRDEWEMSGRRVGDGRRGRVYHDHPESLGMRITR